MSHVNGASAAYRLAVQVCVCVWMMWLCALYRCCHVTDIGVGYLSTMTSLCRLYLRWCTLLRDFGLQHLYTMKNLTALSLAGSPSNAISLHFLPRDAMLARYVLCLSVRPSVYHKPVMYQND